MNEQPKPLTAPLPPHVLAGEGLAARSVDVGVVPVEEQPTNIGSNILVRRGNRLLAWGYSWFGLTAVVFFLAESFGQQLVHDHFATLNIEHWDYFTNRAFENAQLDMMCFGVIPAAVPLLFALICALQSMSAYKVGAALDLLPSCSC